MIGFNVMVWVLGRDYNCICMEGGGGGGARD